ncbi:MAG: hypothetical protein CMJ85_08465 [Planctomycetes bacterium]|nr:hypothetical protein [Planctomycetota bacterium]
MLDFRSDTVTRPTPEMRRAMAEAVVGDDVLGDDPTVQELEREFAERIGKEAALFCPSGTMCNLIAVSVWCRPGDEAVMEEGTHTFRYEGGGAARIAGVQVWTFYRDSGVPEVSDLLDRVRNSVDDHQPRTTLFVLENSHNMAGGRVVPLARVRELADAARAHGVKLHVDGARLFNAATALGLPVAGLAAPADSVMCCLSKGLGAPVGSCLAGDRAFIAEARRVRKALGGGMRQVGVLAAAGLIALREGPKWLAEDHERAQRLAVGLGRIDGLVVDPADVDTNIVRVELDGLDTATVVHTLARYDLHCFAPRRGRLRFVLHRDLTDADIDVAIHAAEQAVTDVRSGGGVTDSGVDAEPWDG